MMPKQGQTGEWKADNNGGLRGRSSMIGFHSRGFHHGPEPRPLQQQEAADMFAVRPRLDITPDLLSGALSATSLRPRQGQAA